MVYMLQEFVFYNHSEECFVLFFKIFNIWKLHNFWLAKPFGLANQNVCYFQNLGH